MTQRVHFIKMHGAGNDYIYVDTLLYNIEHPTEAARRWSMPHTGIGSDGLVLIGGSKMPEADFSMRIFNADGSEAMMCGNASRCIGKYLYEKGLTDKTDVRLLTLSGIKRLQLHLQEAQNGRRPTVESVSVDMGTPLFDDDTLYNPRLASELATALAGVGEGVFVSMGNPHYVVFTDDVDRVATDGPRLERHPAFPARCNIEFAQPLADGRIRMRVWERGSGITMACGTGACATAVAAALTGRAGRESQVVMDGGTLTVSWNAADGHVCMTGPAEFVFEGDIEL